MLPTGGLFCSLLMCPHPLPHRDVTTCNWTNGNSEKIMSNLQQQVLETLRFEYEHVWKRMEYHQGLRSLSTKVVVSTALVLAAFLVVRPTNTVLKIGNVESWIYVAFSVLIAAAVSISTYHELKTMTCHLALVAIERITNALFDGTEVLSFHSVYLGRIVIWKPTRGTFLWRFPDYVLATIGMVLLALVIRHLVAVSQLPSYVNTCTLALLLSSIVGNALILVIAKRKLGRELDEHAEARASDVSRLIQRDK